MRQGARPRGVPPTLVTASFVALHRLQVLWITFVLKIMFPKVSFRLDSERDPGDLDPAPRNKRGS